LPGHRVIVDEENFYLRVETPGKEIRKNILFNDEKTALLHIPERVRFELKAIEKGDKHHIEIRNVSSEIIYDYSVNGDRVEFEPIGRQWFASQIPRVMSEMGL
jgi:hypothetical protein